MYIRFNGIIYQSIDTNDAKQAIRKSKELLRTAEYLVSEWEKAIDSFDEETAKKKQIQYQMTIKKLNSNMTKILPLKGETKQWNNF